MLYQQSVCVKPEVIANKEGGDRQPMNLLKNMIGCKDYTGGIDENQID